MEKQEQENIFTEFKEVVNMTASALEKWLKTDESKAVGWDSGDGESIGHKSGEHIVNILHKKQRYAESAWLCQASPGPKAGPSERFQLGLLFKELGTRSQ